MDYRRFYAGLLNNSPSNLNPYAADFYGTVWMPGYHIPFPDDKPREWVKYWECGLCGTSVPCGESCNCQTED